MNVGPELLDRLRAQTPAMLDVLARIVSAESPSSDLGACMSCADVVAEECGAVLGSLPERIEVEGRTHLRWRSGAPRVVLLGHLDTVWPLGTLTRRPFEVRDGYALGPGVFDMKTGIVQALFAIAALGIPEGVELLINSDEEIGSRTSRALIESSARGAEAVLVLEASEQGALKVARKGVSMYTLRVAGRAAHAGLEPHRGVNALVELSHQVLALERIARPEQGTTVTPTVARAGTTTNTVPADAEVRIDVRCATAAEQERVETEMRALAARIDGARVEVEGGANRPPMQRSASAALFERARRVAGSLGLSLADGVEVGGASDGNYTAGVGTPTLDGLGAVGGGAHAEDERALVAAIPERTALVAGLIASLLAESLGRSDEREGRLSTGATKP